MTDLPRTLKAWRPQLELLQHELALALAPLVQRLSVSIGPFAEAAHTPSGAPDGYDGVDRRGPYERLLMTEWLFAEAAPEEFTRRAASGEHLFTRLAHAEPNVAQRCLVLFDAGPSQLGTPRVAHLAALVVFAARAEAAGAKLWWGVLQNEDASPRPGFSKEVASALLSAGTWREPTEEALARWLGSLDAQADEVWLVGGAGLERLRDAGRFQLLRVDDVLVPGTNRLEVEVRKKARSRKKVTLDLPSPQACTSLLRLPWKVEAPRPVPPRPRGDALLPAKGLVFGLGGSRLFSLAESGELVITPVPVGGVSSVRTIAFRPPQGERVVAGGWRKGPLAVTARVNGAGAVTHLIAYPLSKRGTQKGNQETYAVAPGSELPAFDELAPVVSHTSSSERRLLLLTASGPLTLVQGAVKHLRMPLVTWTAAPTPCHLRVDSVGNRFATQWVSQRTELRFERFDGVGPFFGLFGTGWSRRFRGFPAMAVAEEARPTRWHVDALGAPQDWPLDVPVDSRVVALRAGETTVALLTLEPDQRTLLLRTLSPPRTVDVAPARIVSVATDIENGRIAWLDADGGLSLLERGSELRVLRGAVDRATGRCHFVPGGAP